MSSAGTMSVTAGSVGSIAFTQVMPSSVGYKIYIFIYLLYFIL